MSDSTPSTEPLQRPPTPPRLAQVPGFFHVCETTDVIQMVSEMMNRLIAYNDSIPMDPSQLTRFHSRAPPSITISDYMRRIVKYASIEKSVLLLILIYIDRVCQLHPNFTVCSLTAHRFIISAITVGSKSISDIYCTNSHFAKVGGISLLELNLLELEFCKMICWNLATTAEALQSYYINLVRTSSQYVCSGLSE